MHAIWTVPYNAQGVPDTSACQMRTGLAPAGPSITDKYRLILFGRYPFDEQWRPATCVALFIALYISLGNPLVLAPELILIWSSRSP